MKFDQYGHKQQYGLPRTAKLKGFLVVNEEKNDMLAFFQEDDGIVRSGYTKELKYALVFGTIEKAQSAIESLGKPLLVSALYQSKGQAAVAAIAKYVPKSVDEFSIHLHH